MEAFNAVEKKSFNDEAVNKVSSIKTDAIGQDTYYFKAGQVLDWHRHPTGDQVFFVHEGTGTYYTQEEGGSEEEAQIAAGCVMFAPKNVWHKIVAGGELIVSQATVQPAGMETK